MEVQTISPSVACMKVPISEEKDGAVSTCRFFFAGAFSMLVCSPQSLEAHTEHSRRWAIRLESTSATAAASTTTVASEATTSTAAERHVCWLSGALLVEDRGSEGSVGCVPPSFLFVEGSLCATLCNVVGVVQLRYAAFGIAVVDL